MPSNLAELQQFMIEEWNAIPNNLLINLVNLIKNRCALIMAKEFVIKLYVNKTRIV